MKFFRSKRFEAAYFRMGAVLLVAMLISAGSIIYLYYINSMHTLVLEELHRKHIVAELVHRNSDDLNNRIRTYAVARDTKDESNYKTMSEIRASITSVPEHYTRDYWDSMQDGGVGGGISTNRVEITSLAKKANFTKLQMSLLEDFLKYSKGLVNLELEGVNKFKQDVDKSHQEYLDMITTLFSDNFEDEKIRVMGSINAIFASIVSEAARKIETLVFNENIARWVFGISMVVILLKFLRIYFLVIRPMIFLRRAIIRKSDIELARYKSLQRGDARTIVDDYQELLGELREKTITAEKRLEELNLFTRITSHDLQAPLKNISVMSEALGNKAINLNDGAKAKFVSNINQSANRLIQLINDLRSLIHIDSVPLKCEVIDVTGCLEGTAEEVIGKDFKKHCHFSHQGEFLLNCVPSLFRQLAFNLIRNAWLHSSRDEICIDLEKRDGKSIMRVKNQCEQVIDRPQELLKPFKRGRATTNEGSGLGLYICNKLVQAHGGHLKLAVYEKNTFTVEISL